MHLGVNVILAACLCGQVTAERPIRPEGTRAKLSVGELFVPVGYQPKESDVRLVVHLHGSPELMERHVTQSGWNAILVTVTLNGLSSVYTKQFADPNTFTTLLDESAGAIAKQINKERVSIGHITVSSFSAGFGGVRELLKSEECYRRIDTLIMADSIYAGYVGDAKEHRVDPVLTAGFLRFARDAAAGKKHMVISHCQLQPEGYASTAETADYLIRELGLTRQPVSEAWADQWQCTSRCEHGQFHVFGFDGTEGADHLRHLRNLGKLMRVVAK